MRINPRSFALALVLSASAALAHAPRASAQTFEIFYAFRPPGGSQRAGLVAGPTGILYGATQTGGDFVQGLIFSLTPDGSGGFTRQDLYSFARAEGSGPAATMILGPDGNLYGTTHGGGAADDGTIFRFGITGSLLRLHDFADGGGAHPSGLILASDGNFYGVASDGGANSAGTIFRSDPAGNVTIFHSFDPATEGRAPIGELLQSGAFFYGTTSAGGANDKGTVYRIDLVGGTLTTLHEFDGTDGADPESALILATDGNFYGTTRGDQVNSLGTIYHVDSAGSFGTLHSFTGNDGEGPVAALFQASDGRLYGSAASGGLGGGKDMFPAGTLFRVDLAGNFGVFQNFIVGIAGNGPGGGPLGAMIDGHDGFLYGTTFGSATAYRVALTPQFSYVANLDSPGYAFGPSAPVTEAGGALYGTIGNDLLRLEGGVLTKLHSFGSVAGDGSGPANGLLLASDGNLYGATHQSGAGSAPGTIFRYDIPGSTYEKIHDFDVAEGSYPNGYLIEPSPGNFIGTTSGDGFTDFGSVFQMDTSGTVTPLHHLASDEVHTPYDGPALSPSADYWAAGTFDPNAAIFSVDSNGVFTNRHTLDFDTEGGQPSGPLLWASDGKLYGMAINGGSGANGTVFRYGGSPALTILKTFLGDADGGTPSGGLIQASDGNIYGVTQGTYNVTNGSVFRIDSTGAFATVHSFGPVDGAIPQAGLTEASDGDLYGTAAFGGLFNAGVVYRLVLGTAAPALTAIAPTSGRAAGGTAIAISGAHLFTASGATIGGVAAVTPFIPDQGSVHTVSPALAPGTLNDVTVETGGSGLVQESVTLPGAWFADFADVGQDDIFHSYVETIFRNGITAGCGGGSYCRNASVTRAQMAVFLLKSEHGSTYVPPPCQGTFPDVACPSTFADWIEQLGTEGVTAGCGGGLYCPDAPVTRRQMAVFLLKTKEGSGYSPPPATGVFGDVPADDPSAPWIEELYHRDITGGCQAVPLMYCPDQPNTRGQMAVFLTKTFELP